MNVHSCALENYVSMFPQYVKLGLEIGPVSIVLSVMSLLRPCP